MTTAQVVQRLLTRRLRWVIPSRWGIVCLFGEGGYECQMCSLCLDLFCFCLVNQLAWPVAVLLNRVCGCQLIHFVF